MTQVSLMVPEVHCGHCKMSLESAVGALEGVSHVEVSIPETKIAVDYDEGSVALDTIKATIEGQGYAVFG